MAVHTGLASPALAQALARVGVDRVMVDLVGHAATARQVGEAAQAMGIGFMDTPVSGGVAAAAAGSLAFMCGGDAQTFERARLIRADMGKNIFHAGHAGAGQVAKGCNKPIAGIARK